jgi:hypothetical protein
MSLTISPSPFGSLVVSVAETGSTLSVTTVATSPSVLTMALGVPGPTGATGATGATGPAGAAGVGVPVGGTTSQALVKVSGTNYDTTWAGPFLDLTGGTLSGTLFLPGLRNLLNTDLTVTAYNDTGAGTNFVHTFDAFDGTFALATNGGGLIFPDETVQTTAGLPLTGGTVTGLVTFDGANGAYISVENFSGITTYIGDGVQLSDGVNNLKIFPTGITFPDNTIQTTAFPGYTGTTSEYIDGTGDYITFPAVGDRYLTSSTSTLTCDSGNGKTMTVGTGLSYSRQQDITVSYSNSIHMHGTVLTYNSATGVMTWDSNTHSGSGTFSNWEVNVGGVAGAILPVGGTAGQVLAKINSTNFNTEWISLGTMATATASDYLAKADNLSGLASTSTARTNLGLGTAATESTATFLQTANNLSDVTASTARTNLGLGAVSTDAYATNLQAVQNTSSTTVLSPANSRFAGISTNIWSPGVTGLSAGSSGTGANSGSTVTSLNGLLIAPNATTAGYATRGFNLYLPSNSVNAGYNFGTTSGHSVRVYSNTWATAVTGVKMRAVFGRMSGGLPTPGTLASRGYGWEWDYSTKVISIIAHNGTSLTTTAQTWTPVSFRTYEIAVYSNGAGTISLYIDGTLIGTGTGGPTDTSVTSQVWWQMEIENQATAGSQQTIAYQNPKLITTNG